MGLMINTILWDVDGTLLDFKAAEYAAIKSLFKVFKLGECTDRMVARYSVINDSFWKRLERNEISKRQVLVGRFEQFFGEYGIDSLERNDCRADKEAAKVRTRSADGRRFPVRGNRV